MIHQIATSDYWELLGALIPIDSVLKYAYQMENVDL